MGARCFFFSLSLSLRFCCWMCLLTCWILSVSCVFKGERRGHETHQVGKNQGSAVVGCGLSMLLFQKKKEPMMLRSKEIHVVEHHVGHPVLFSANRYLLNIYIFLALKQWLAKLQRFHLVTKITLPLCAQECTASQCLGS